MNGYQQCRCGDLFRCGDCRKDVCFCTCVTDGTPHTQEAVTAGWFNPSQERFDAWQEKQELTR